MTASPHPRRLATYVVHTQRVIAEDLRDILSDLGVTDIHIASRLSQAPTKGIALAVVAARARDLSELPHLRLWAELGVPVVILDGFTGLEDIYPGVAHLSQPFQSADIAATLARLGVV